MLLKNAPEVPSLFVEEGTADSGAENTRMGTFELQRRIKEVATLSHGNMIGEMSFLTDSPRSATVIARTPVLACKLQADKLASVMSSYPDLRRKIWQVYVFVSYLTAVEVV